MQPRSRETLQGTIRRLLDVGYVDVAGRTIEAITASTTDADGLIQRRLAELDAEVARLAEADEHRLRPDNAVVRALLADLDVVMRRNGSRIDATGDTLVTGGVDAAGQLTRQLALAGIGDGQLRLSVNREWAVADPEVVNRLVSYVEMPAWVDELAQYGEGVVGTVGNQAILGMAQGWSPLRVVREIRRMTETLPASVANTLMRTVFLESYRSGTAIHQNANVQLIDRVVRIESLDSRICVACIYRHGEVIWDRTRDGGSPVDKIDEHHNGRGTTITIVRGVNRVIRRGEDWFMGLGTDRQRALMRNDAAFDAWRAGAVQLSDFVKPYEDRVFGSMMRQASLKDMLGDGAREWYK